MDKLIQNSNQLTQNDVEDEEKKNTILLPPLRGKFYSLLGGSP